MITISGVPNSTRKPGVYGDINTKAAKMGLPTTTDRVLIIATQGDDATVTEATPTQVYSKSEARTLFGAGSPAALMVQAMLECNPYINELWVCPLDPAASTVAAAGTIAFAASGLTAGTLTVYIGRHAVTVGVTDDDTATTVAAAVVAAVNAQTWLPVEASNSTYTVTLTNKVGGTSGNKWVLAADYTGSGLTATVTQPSSGATDPDIQDALDAVVQEWFDIIVSEWSTATPLDALIAHLDLVSGPLEQRPGVGVAGYVGTVSGCTTITSARNSGRLTVGYMRGTRTHPMEIAAGYAGLIVSEEDRARPLNTLELSVGEAPDTLSNRLSRTEIESLLLNGAAPFNADNQGVVRLERSITTYVENEAGDADDTLLDLQTIRVLDYVRYAVATRLRAELARSKVADQARTPNTTDPDKVRSLILGVLYQLQDTLGYVEKVDDHKDRLVVERSELSPNRLNAQIPADIVDGLHVVAFSVDLILA